MTVATIDEAASPVKSLLHPIPDADTVGQIARALFHLDLGHRHIRHQFATELGVNLTELSALILINSLIDATPKKLADALDLTTGSVTSVLDRLEEHGLTLRERHPSDRRSVVLRLTAEGRRSMNWILTDYRQAIAASLPSSAGVDTCELISALHRLADGVKNASPSLHAAPSQGPEITAR